MTGMVDAGDVLDSIYRNNLFLISLDGRRKWYRYHHLLSEAVRERMKASAPERLRALYRQAALWFARNDYLEDAFREAFASEDFDFAADLLEDNLISIVDRYEYASGRRWLSRLPHTVFMQRALLRLHDCGQKVETFQLDEIEAVVSDIEGDRDGAFSRYTGKKRRLCEDIFTYFKHTLFYYYRDPAHPDLEKLECAARVISSENRVFSGYIRVLIALYHLAQGSPLQAEAQLQEASPLIISSGSAWARVLWFKVSATVQRVQGRLRRSEAVLREALEFLEERNISDTPLRYSLYLPMAWIYYNRNELKDALTYATGATTYAEHVEFVRDIAEGNLLLALIHFADSRMNEARECLQKVRVATERPGVSEVSLCAEPWLARLSMAEGDIRHAVEWSNQMDFSLDGRFSSQLVHDALTRVELSFRRELYQEAIVVLTSLKSLCLERNMMEAVLLIDIAQAAILYACNRRDEAQRIMDQALSFAEEEGYVRPFCSNVFIFPLLCEMKQNSSRFQQSSVLSRMIVASNTGDAGQGGPAKRRDAHTGGELTERELEILRLLAVGRRYKEIAQDLFVSMDTVKTHMRHIFEKLDVDSRVKAVNRARSLRLLTE